MKTKWIVYVFVILCLLSRHYNTYAQGLIYPDSVIVEKIRISPDHAMGGEVSDYIEDIQYFKLERPTKGWIENITAAYTIDKHVVLIDNRKGELYLYNNGGELIADSFVPRDVATSNRLTINIDNRSLYTSSFSKKAKDDNDVLLDGDRYTLRGEWQEELVLCTQDIEGKTLILSSCARLDDRTWVFYERPANSYAKKTATILALQKDNDMIPLLQLDTLTRNLEETNVSGGGFYSSVLNDELIAYYAHPYSYELVEINTNGISKVYKFVLPQKYTVPADIYDHPDYIEKGVLPYFQEIAANRSLVRQLDNVIRYKDYLVFSFMASSGGGRYAYSLKTGEFVNLRSLVPDTGNSFLPLFARMTITGLFSDGEYLYNIVYPQDVQQSIMYLYEGEGRAVPDWVRDMANYDNPILVRFKLK